MYLLYLDSIIILVFCISSLDVYPKKNSYKFCGCVFLGMKRAKLSRYLITLIDSYFILTPTFVDGFGSRANNFKF